MAKTAKKLKLHGLTGRWVTNVLSVVFAVLFVVGIVLALLLNKLYYDEADEFVNEKCEEAIQALNEVKTTADFAIVVKSYAENFTEHHAAEVQFFDCDGVAVLSTAGYIDPAQHQDNGWQTKELFDEETKKVIPWEETTPEGERLLMGARSFVFSENKVDHTVKVRVVVSLDTIDQQFTMIVVAIIIAGLALFLVIAIFGAYFIRSIVSPVNGLSQQATKIAHGDFKTRIQIDKRRKDEITALCDTINHMAEELGSTEQMKNEFISSVSHELRTPLTAIKGWGETVAGSLDDPVLVRKGMSVIVGEAERLSGIVEDLLDFSRMQDGRLTYDMAPCDVVAEMDEAILSLSANAAEQKIHMDFTEPNNIPIIEGDADRLQQVFVNVLGNSLKYTPQEGHIVVDMKYHPNENEIEIMISDTGRGIDPDDLDHIKQKFYKGKDAERGSGIGLAIADEIVTAHGGRLEIASTLRVGTTVTIWLPTEQKKSDR